MQNNCSLQDFGDDTSIRKNESKTLAVIIITFFTMFVEIFVGRWSGSMSLYADGWHMASHAGALGIAWLAYRISRSESFSKTLTFGSGKIIPLGGYTSALMLVFVAIFMIVESFQKILSPNPIIFNEALIVALLGLVINLICAWILYDSPQSPTNSSHHGHNHHDAHQDQNLKAAYLHVISDALTSVLAIVSLLVGKYSNVLWLDPLVGVLGGLMILKWSVTLIQSCSHELLDGAPKLNWTIEVLQKHFDAGTQIKDLHVWRIAPQKIACELVVTTNSLKGSQYYRDILIDHFGLHHVIIEENIL